MSSLEDKSLQCTLYLCIIWDLGYRGDLLLKCISSFFFAFFILKFYEYISSKLSWDHTRPLEKTWGFKGLVARAKWNCDSYESELVVLIAFFLFTQGCAKSGCGGICLDTKSVKLNTPYYLLFIRKRDYFYILFDFCLNFVEIIFW